MKSSLIVVASLLVLACAGCGNKGPLYLPQRPTATPAAALPAQPSTDDSKAAAAGAKP
jgi:predicted small lipoprotein YifL